MSDLINIAMQNRITDLEAELKEKNRRLVETNGFLHDKTEALKEILFDCIGGQDPRTLRGGVLKAIVLQIKNIAEDALDEDPTPWCSACGAKLAKDCKCGPIADND